MDPTVRNNSKTSAADIKINAIEQARLLSAADGGVDSIDAMIQKLRGECPAALRANACLLTRVLFHRRAEEWARHRTGVSLAAWCSAESFFPEAGRASMLITMVNEHAMPAFGIAATSRICRVTN
jgi:hypothetical protein